MRYYSEETVARILYDIDYDIKGLPQAVFDYPHIELTEPIGSVQNADLLRNCIDDVIEQNRGKEVQAETSANTICNCADVRSVQNGTGPTQYTTDGTNIR